MELFISGRFVRQNAAFPFKDPEIISATFYDEKNEVLFQRGKTSFAIHRPLKVLHVCPEETFSRDTIESAAINTSYYIRKTFKKFKEANPDIHVTPVSLNITPELIRSEVFTDMEGRNTKSSSYMSDNALYVNHTSAIVFLPHSETYKLMNEMNYWEIPLVASHEYGHHLFKTVFGSSINTNSHGCFGTPRSATSEKNQGLRKVSIENVLNAYNEGFADLIAWYSLDKEEKDVSGVKCLEATRDAGSAAFYDGAPKKFSVEIIALFFSGFNQYSTGNCESTNYQNSHTIGAIFAHTVDQFFELLSLSHEQRIKVIVNWVKYLKVERSNSRSGSAKEWMKKTYAEILRQAVSEAEKTFDKKTCNKIEELFPELDMNECTYQP